MLTAAAALTASQHGTILLLDEAGEQATHRIALDSGNMAPLELVAKPILRQGLAGWVVRERRAALVRDTEQDLRWLPGPGLGDMRSALVAPLLRDDRVLGVITLAHDLPGRYTDDHLQLLETLGAQAALAIERTHLVAAASQPSQTDSAAALPVLELAASSPVSQQPSSHEVVAVFTDMRGFAKASEQLPPDVLVKEVLDVHIQAHGRGDPAAGWLGRDVLGRRYPGDLWLPARSARRYAARGSGRAGDAPGGVPAAHRLAQPTTKTLETSQLAGTLFRRWCADRRRTQCLPVLWVV